MPYSLVLEIEGLPKTINAIGREHWAVKVKEIRHWKEIIWGLTINQRPNAPLKKAKLVLTRFSSTSPDFDGLVSSFKALVDGLIVAKVIENDKVENVGMPEYRWEKIGKGKGRVKVEVYEA